LPIINLPRTAETTDHSQKMQETGWPINFVYLQCIAMMSQSHFLEISIAGVKCNGDNLNQDISTFASAESIRLMLHKCLIHTSSDKKNAIILLEHEMKSEDQQCIIVYFFYKEHRMNDTLLARIKQEQNVHL